ncbi:hypothetical protein Btru_055414 [Bulinus truncatus]|nr:hypothetical protein Btru_055414 [Bulinus truncatus]
MDTGDEEENEGRGRNAGLPDRAGLSTVMRYERDGVGGEGRPGSRITTPIMKGKRTHGHPRFDNAKFSRGITASVAGVGGFVSKWGERPKRWCACRI